MIAAGECELPQGKTPLTAADLSKRGPYKSMKIEVSFVDDSRITPATADTEELASRTLDCNLWVPDSDAGPFPLLVWSHGSGSTKDEPDFFAPVLASRGYVVIAPAFPLTKLGTPGGSKGLDLPNQAGDLGFLIDEMLKGHADSASPVFGKIDEARIAVGGLSLGAATTLLGTYFEDLRDPRIKASIVFASPGGYYSEAIFEGSSIPLLSVHGSTDAIVPYDPHATSLWDRASSPLWSVTLDKGTHTGFTPQGLAIPGNPDSLGCGVRNPNRTNPWDVYEAMGGEKAGFSMLGAIPDTQVTCDTDPLPESMTAQRQQDVTLPLVVAYLATYLDADASERSRACDYLKNRVEADLPEVSIQTR